MNLLKAREGFPSRGQNRLVAGEVSPAFWFVRNTFFLGIAAFCGFFSACLGDDFEPDHPRVREMIEKGVAYLSDPQMTRSRTGAEYEALIGYTVLKATEDYEHPLVRSGVNSARKIAQRIAEREPILRIDSVVYQASVAAMMLASHDPIQNANQIEQLRDYLQNRQRPDGSFGYLEGPYANTGDTSQAQYVMLAFWSLKQAGVEIDSKVVDKAATWLSKIQRGDGGWMYQNPGSYPATHQMLAAGWSATLIAGDLLGLVRGTPGKLTDRMASSDEDIEMDDDEGDGVPAAFRRVYDDPVMQEKARAMASKDMSRPVLQRISNNADRWLKSNRYNRQIAKDWHYYWLYSRERYEAFLEMFNGRRVKSPEWYNEGVRELLALQTSEGAWGVTDPDPGGKETATCFAILFLLRSTQKAIGDVKEATNFGGYGLANVADVGLIDGKVVDKSQISSIDDAMKMLEGNQEGGAEDKLLADRVQLENDPKKRKEQLNRFSRLLRSTDYRARRVAAKVLGRGDDLSYVPDLIYAISDPDGIVARTAETSLRILSRQLDTIILPKEGVITADDLVKAERHWKRWYLSVKPDHIFLD